MADNVVKLISVGMVLYNQGPKAINALTSIKKSAEQIGAWEVIVVDNSSTSETGLSVKDYLEKQNISFQFHQARENNLGRARAWIVEHAKAEWIYFTDPDCELETLNLSVLWNLGNSQNKTQLGGVGGINRAPEGQHWYWEVLNHGVKSPIGHFYSSQNWAPPKLQSVSHLSTSNALFKREALLAVGNFSSKFAKTGEDLELGLRLNQAGYKLLLTKEAIVRHELPQSPWVWAQKIFVHGRTQVMVARQTPALLKTHKLLPLIALFILLVLGFWSLPIFFGVALFYLILTFFLIWKLPCENEPRKIKFICSVCGNLVLTHSAYAIGQLAGLFKWRLAQM